MCQTLEGQGNYFCFNFADHRLCPHWHWIVLWLSCAGNVLLMVAMILIGVHGPGCSSSTALDRSSQNPEETTGISNIHQCNHLESKTNSQLQAFRSSSWTQSYKDCVAKGSQLLVISNTEEQKYIQDIIKNKSTSIAWIGLIVKLPEEKWMWINGSLNQTLPQRLTADCGVIGKKGIGSDMCNTELNWICQKPSVFI
ncbi:hypothetical protein E2320_014637 [Naja naja]|nr:hypothetical protein E2320_014637 [Naja naja]